MSPLLSPRHDAVILSDEYLSSGEAFSPARPGTAAAAMTTATDNGAHTTADANPRAQETLKLKTLQGLSPVPVPRAGSPTGSSSTGCEARGGAARVDADAAAEAAAARQAQVDADLRHAARQTPDRCAAGGVEAPGTQVLPPAPSGCGSTVFLVSAEKGRG